MLEYLAPGIARQTLASARLMAVAIEARYGIQVSRSIAAGRDSYRIKQVAPVIAKGEARSWYYRICLLLFAGACGMIVSYDQKLTRSTSDYWKACTNAGLSG
jgi:hypothetical protein